MAASSVIVGTAGWSIPKDCSAAMPGDGTHLSRYARVLRGVEINTSFYRPHAFATYAKWAASVPRKFLFAVKLPQHISHELRLRRARRPLEVFLAQVAGLGAKLGPLLLQLPPSHAFDRRVAQSFFSVLRSSHDGFVVCEPRHASWFSPRAEELLIHHRIARVAADPALRPEAAQPGGWPGIAYFRLHGSPDRYWSVYTRQQLQQWERHLRAMPIATPCWCVFDNTAGGGALANALTLSPKRRAGRRPAAAARYRTAAAV